MGINDFSLRVVGCYYDNPDGSSRQAEIANCWPGEVVELYREPDNPHDPSAVAVFSRRGVQVGYLGKDRCGWIGSKIDRKYEIHAIVERVLGATLPGSTLGLIIRLNMEGDKPDLDVRPRFGSNPAFAVQRVHF
ncbi:MAG: hypothetical protein JWQ03_3096 [Variovorax sp.]|nr:hypothetical protein [Variovorax sp.]